MKYQDEATGRRWSRVIDIKDEHIARRIKAADRIIIVPAAASRKHETVEMPPRIQDMIVED
jgi:hypothetical protein